MPFEVRLELEAGEPQAKVKHADETGWRTDGHNGYAWLFCTKTISIFRFRQTRSGQVALQVLGAKRLRGVLVVDRYHGYNRAFCAIQYCYAHMLRNVQDLEKEFLSEAKKVGLYELKGHRSVGGIRASIYNAMPVEGVRALRDFMESFRKAH